MSFLQEKISILSGIQSEGVKDISHNLFKNYDQILIASQKYSSLMKDHEQEVVSVILPNSIEYIEVMIACINTGNIFNPIPFFTSDNELERILEYVEPKIVFTNRDLPENMKKDWQIHDPMHSQENNHPKFERVRDSNGADIAALYYSSGTTGNPKGVLYSHDNVFYLIDSIIRGFDFSASTKHFSVLPFGHTASINYNIFPSLFCGSTLVIAEGFSSIAPQFFKILSEEKINYTQLVPTIVYMLLKISYKINKLDLSNLIFIGCGSSILPKETQIQFYEKFKIRIANLYGLSETGPTHIDDPRNDDWTPGTIGIPLDVNECKITDESEILIKGNNVFVGYYKNQELYEEVVNNGWFSTGDIVTFESGKYHYKDRSKDLIIKGGINIVPAEIEEILYSHKEVHEAVVTGINNKILGEEILASVTLKESSLSPSEIKSDLYKLLQENLSSYKHPIDILFFDTLPKTHSGKLKRREVRQIVEEKYN